MKQTIYQHQFIEAFRNCNRLKTEENNGNFTIEGLRALFEYIEEYEESTGEEIELDVIGLCSDLGEYNNWKEVIQDYGYLLEREDYDSEQEYKEALLNELQDHTTVIIIDEEDGHFIVGVF